MDPVLAAPEVERRPRAMWRAIALPDEHGGWGLTAEPVLLGLLVAPSWPGAAIGVGALAAFMVRTPLKVVLVDVRRHRWLPRTRLAAGTAAGELVLLAVLAAVAVGLSSWAWLVPVAVAAPLVAIELWFDMRSRSRRLAPELCGAVAISGVAAAIALAGGAHAPLAIALWLVLAGRVLASVPFVRVQIGKLRRRSVAMGNGDLAGLAGTLVAVSGSVADRAVLGGSLAVAGLAVIQAITARRDPVPAKTLGVRQMLLGLVVVAATAASVALVDAGA